MVHRPTGGFSYFMVLIAFAFYIVAQDGKQSGNEDHEVNHEIAVGSRIDIVHQPEKGIEQIPEPGEGRLGLHTLKA